MIVWPTIEGTNETFREMDPNPDEFEGERYMPSVDYDKPGQTLRWAVYKSTSGLTHHHVLDTDPVRIKADPVATFAVEAQAYKELYHIKESDILGVANLADHRQAEGAARLVGKGLRKLKIRTKVRKEADRWEIFTTGKIVVNEFGIKRTVDFGIPAGNFLSVGSGVVAAWSDTAASRPLDDFIAAIDKLEDLPVDEVHILMNRNTAKLLVNNEQIADKVAGLPDSKRRNISNISSLLAELLGEVDRIAVYNKGYIPEGGSSQTKFIPDNIVVVLGLPSEASSEGSKDLGKWFMTENLHAGTLENPMPGEFAIPDYSDAAPEKGNPKVDILGGVYGLGVLQLPNHVVVIDVSAP